MARQWDTKKQFKSEYGAIAGMVFLGWLRALREENWRGVIRDLCNAWIGLITALGGVVLGLALLLTSPLSFPLMCWVHRAGLRRKRLEYIRRNRQADRDI